MKPSYQHIARIPHFRSHAQIVPELNRALGYSPPLLVEWMAEDAKKSAKNDRLFNRRSLLLHNKKEY